MDEDIRSKIMDEENDKISDQIKEEKKPYGSASVEQEKKQVITISKEIEIKPSSDKIQQKKDITEIKKRSTKMNITKHIDEIKIVSKPVIQYHIVKQGECLWVISKRYNVDVDAIVKANNISNPNLIRIGKKLVIPQSDGFEYKEKKDIQAEIENPAPAIVHQDYKNFLKKKKVTFEWPVIGRVTSDFGVRRSPYNNKMEFHTGIDIGAKQGKKFAAAEDGKVSFVGQQGGYGLMLIIQHAKGYETRYGHCLITLVRKGQYVKKGQTVGRIGETGLATGPHLHFEVRRNNLAIDPTTLINKRQLFY